MTACRRNVDGCVSCDIHYNTSLLRPLIPLLDSQQIIQFFNELFDLLEASNIEHIYSILKVANGRYTPVSYITKVKRDLLASHRLEMVLQWYKAKASYPLRVTFILKVLCFVDQDIMRQLTRYLAMLSAERVPQPHNDSEATFNPWSGQWPYFTEKRGSVDFISSLPVTVSKLILSYVPCVWTCRSVNKRWYILVKELLAEERQFRSHVFRCQALRPATRNVNPENANKSALCFAKGVCNTGHPYVSESEDHVKVILEERNVYCSPFHVITVTRHSDSHRKFHYARGRFIAIGSKDRKVRIKWAKTGKLHRTIVGHAGSIRTCLLLEDKKVVLSGSYDTTIRAWSLETGACVRLWRGHRGTVTTLDAGDRIFISGSKDRLVKVWYLDKAVLKKTLSHQRPVIAVKLLGDRAIVGTESYKAFVWDVLQGILLKTLPTDGPVNCVYLTPHYLLGGGGSVLYVWNMISLDTAPMYLLPHPETVLAVQYCYVRSVTGCSDGKVRVWNLVHGQCIKVIRGNASSDPITQLYLDENRLYINTMSSIMLLNFAPVQWDYCSEPFLKENKVEVKEEKRQNKKKIKTTAHKTIQDYVKKNSVFSAVPPSPYRNVRIEGWGNREVEREKKKENELDLRDATFSDGYPITTEGPDFSSQEYPAATYGDNIASHGYPAATYGENIASHGYPAATDINESSVYKVADELELFRDNFNRINSRIGMPKDVEVQKPFLNIVGSSCQLQRGRSKRPQSAPFPSKVLSVHGQLPSFNRRRPKTAATLRNHIAQIEAPESWQSAWQNLLEDTAEPEPCKNNVRLRAQSAVSVTEHKTIRAVRRPATAKIRY